MSSYLRVNEEPALKSIFKQKRLVKSQIEVFDFLSRDMDYSKKLQLAEQISPRLLYVTLKPQAHDGFRWATGLSDDKRIKFLTDGVAKSGDIVTLSRLFENYTPQEKDYAPIVKKLRKNQVKSLVALMIEYRRTKEFTIAHKDISYEQELAPIKVLDGLSFKVGSDVFRIHLPKNTQEYIEARHHLNTCIATFAAQVAAGQVIKLFIYKNDKIHGTIQPSCITPKNEPAYARGITFGVNNAPLAEEVKERINIILNQTIMPYLETWERLYKVEEQVLTIK